MKRLLAITAAAAALSAAPVAAWAGPDSPGADGYFSRGIAMFRNGNYNGCIDQLNYMRTLSPTPCQAEEADYYLALASLYIGDDEAVDLLNRFLEDYPESHLCPDVKAAIGEYYLTRANYSEALTWFDKVDSEALSLDSADKLCYHTAYCRMMLGDRERARQLFERVTPDNNLYHAARFYLGYIAYTEGDYASARRIFESVNTSRRPADAAAYYLAQIDFIDRNYDSALARARKALAGGGIEGFTPELNRIAGESLYHLGNDSEAIPYLEKYAAAVSDPQPSALYILGVSDFRNGNYKGAIEQLQRVTDQQNAMGQSAYLYLGNAFVKTGNPDGAIMAFENAYRLDYDPEVTETDFYNFIAARMDGGRVPFGNSVNLLENFLNRYPNSRYASQVRESLVSGYMSDNDYESALRILDNINSPSAEMLRTRQKVEFALGTSRYKAGETESALKLFSRAATSPKPDALITRQALLWKANCLYDLGRWDEAADDYQKFILMAPASDPNLTLARYNLAYTRLEQERYDEALTGFNRLTDAPDVSPAMRADVYNRTGDCLYYAERYNEAAERYRKAYSLNPGAGDYALYRIAMMKGMERDYAGKTAGLDEMIAQFPSSALVPSALLEKAETYAAQNRQDDAIATYRRLVDEYPSTSYARQGYVQLAITYLNSGRTESAVDAYKHVIQAYPSSEEASVAVDDLKRIYAAQGRLPELASFVNSVGGAPRIDPSELDAAAFRSAEDLYASGAGSTARLEAYLRDYPSGQFASQALYYLAESADAAGRRDEAIAHASRIIADHPHSEVAEDALLLRARNEAEAGRNAEALESYTMLESMASTPANLTKARFGVMETALITEDYPRVVSETQKLLATSTTSGTELRQVKYARAVALSHTGDTSGAMELWTELSADPSDEAGVRSSVLLAEALLRQGDAAKAQKVADALINANPSHQYWLARGFIALSDALRAQGETFEADEYLKSLKSNYPGDEADIFQMIEARLKK